MADVIGFLILMAMGSYFAITAFMLIRNTIRLLSERTHNEMVKYVDKYVGKVLLARGSRNKGVLDFACNAYVLLRKSEVPRENGFGFDLVYLAAKKKFSLKEIYKLLKNEELVEIIMHSYYRDCPFCGAAMFQNDGGKCSFCQFHDGGLKVDESMKELATAIKEYAPLTPTEEAIRRTLVKRTMDKAMEKKYKGMGPHQKKKARSKRQTPPSEERLPDHLL